MPKFDSCAFEERSAIAEFCGGLSRFEAETLAAQQQGTTRWQALKLIKDATDANGCGFAGGHGHQARSLDGQRDAGDLSRVQPKPEEENGSLSVGQPEAGRDRGALLALRMVSGEAV